MVIFTFGCSQMIAGLSRNFNYFFSIFCSFSFYENKQPKKKEKKRKKKGPNVQMIPSIYEMHGAQQGIKEKVSYRRLKEFKQRTNRKTIKSLDPSSPTQHESLVVKMKMHES